MRTLSRRPRSEEIAPPRKAAPGRSAINRALERQAEEATNLALHGEINASRVLTPAPAAGFRQPESIAETLPSGVKQQAEVAFGADLEAVRVHRDGPAWQATAAHGAAAFTAGNHIFFGEQQWDPASDTGQRLLYHELSHVLQQTGRRESTTLIRAQDLRGSGGIQVHRRGGRHG